MHSMFQKPKMPVHFWAVAIAGKPDGRSMSLEIPSAQNSLQTNWLPTRDASTPSMLQGRTEPQWAQRSGEMSPERVSTNGLIQTNYGPYSISAWYSDDRTMWKRVDRLPSPTAVLLEISRAW
jgi:hypothetical protein